MPASRRPCLRVAVLLALVALLSTPVAGKPPSWDKRIDKPKRFKVLEAFDDEAVLDKETGLVWERTVNDDGGAAVWRLYRWRCHARGTGGRMGWRMPTADELGSLIDPVIDDLPPGHPFDLQNVTQNIPTATRVDTTTVLELAAPPNSFWTEVSDAIAGRAVWCVRGPAGAPGHF